MFLLTLLCRGLETYRTLHVPTLYSYSLFRQGGHVIGTLLNLKVSHTKPLKEFQFLLETLPVDWVSNEYLVFVRFWENLYMDIF